MKIQEINDKLQDDLVKTLKTLIMIYLFNFLFFVVLSVAYYFNPFSLPEIDGVFLTISTFLFSIFAGFFISRQGGRYSKIREQIARIDGDISNIYRNFQHFGARIQKKAQKIIEKDYNVIIKTHDWDYIFEKKSTTITSLHNLVKEVGAKKLTNAQNLALTRIMYSLANLQLARKMMIVLRQERIPKFQWSLLTILAVILFITVSMIPSFNSLLGAAMKGAFVDAIMFVFILLAKLNRLDLFEKVVGEESAKDVLDIFQGEK
ncbi:DUF4239 domain-containing protein [Candidatus Peregrinibacteria bacterium]|jgi:hypothetical protein|nr:DUF4239 domain-containing protein [Candidatus Peregrinibacteria bacterium]MBT4055638.1 DUF4239 domain-containing protein [Candidatus Peregrinibacteria bacterium]